jgi:hypothetical protein
LVENPSKSLNNGILNLKDITLATHKQLLMMLKLGQEGQELK